METWTPVGVPMYATTSKTTSFLLLQVLGFGSESGIPVLTCVTPGEGYRGPRGMKALRAKYWTDRAAELYGDLTIHPSLSEARELIRRRMDRRKQEEARVIAEAEKLLGAPSLDDPWGGRLS